MKMEAWEEENEETLWEKSKTDKLKMVQGDTEK